MVEDVLKPKSVGEINDFIKDMKLYEFLAVFEKTDISLFKVSIKKKLFRYCLKHFKIDMRIVLFLFITFSVSNMLMIIFRDNCFIIFTLICMSAMVIYILLSSLFLHIRTKVGQWKMDHSYYQ